MEIKTREILKRVKKIEIKTKYLVEGLLQGAYHSIFKGRGIEFSEVREYIPGDDVRIIDWNVTARMNHPYVKEFIEERDLTVYILFDISASSEFGSEKEKKESAIELAASLMFAALKNNDKVGLCLFTNQIERFFPPRNGKGHIMRLVREMIYYIPQNKTTDLNKTLIQISNIAKKRSIIFIISDFMCEGFNKSLKILKNKHDIIAINLKDIREEDIPDIGYIELEDSETGEQFLVNTSDSEFRTNYVNIVEERNKTFSNNLKRLGVDTIQLFSGQSFAIPLRKFFNMRIKRMVR